jgi:hypothetical protein
MNKLANAFGTTALPGAVIKYTGPQGPVVSKVTLRRWERRGWVKDVGFHVLTIDGYRAMR